MSEILTIDLRDDDSLTTKTRLVGQLGEELAARYLVANGFRLVMSNYTVPVGRNILGAPVTGEIDLIALDRETICFVEVKTRNSDFFSSPLAAIDLRKQRQIIRAARIYRKIFNLRGCAYRYDAVAIVLGNENKPKIELRKNFWNEAKFRKKFWDD